VGTWLHIQDVAILPRLIYDERKPQQSNKDTHARTLGRPSCGEQCAQPDNNGLDTRTPGYREQWAISSVPLKMQLRHRNHLLARERQHGLGVNAFPGSKVAGNDPRMMNHAAHSCPKSRRRVREGPPWVERLVARRQYTHGQQKQFDMPFF
jgi:hypothetical protein